MEAYVDDIVVKSGVFDQHLTDLREIFGQLRLFNMRLNPTKCVIGVEGEKFLGFMLTQREIEANPDKCSVILAMKSSTNLKEIQSLVRRLTSLSQFLPRLADKIRPIVRTLKKADKFVWNSECEATFHAVKMTVSSMPILGRLRAEGKLLLYILVSENATSAALVQYEDQKSVYFAERALLDAETKYQLIEKATLAVIYAARQLQPYV